MMMKKTSAPKKTASKKMPAALKASFMGQHKKMAMGDGMKSGGKANATEPTFGKRMSQKESIGDMKGLPKMKSDMADAIAKDAFGKRTSQEEFMRDLDLRERAELPRMKSGGKAKAMNMGGYAMKTGGKAHAKSCKCMACGGSVKY